MTARLVKAGTTGIVAGLLIAVAWAEGGPIAGLMVAIFLLLIGAAAWSDGTWGKP